MRPAAWVVLLTPWLTLFPAKSSASDEAPALPAVTRMELSLEECIALALQKQPNLLAARASLANAEAGLRALNALRFPATLARELPVRRAQACVGIQAAVAALDQAERETVYAVTRNYFTVRYAKQQEREAGEVVKNLELIIDTATRYITAGGKNITEAEVDRAAVYQAMAEARRIQSAVGAQRALAALREAIGMGPNCELQVSEKDLPRPAAQPVREQIIALALERRGDLGQVNAFVKLTALEVQAQQLNPRQQVNTFAAGGDIHAQPVPPGYHNGEYRPGGLLPEMPVLLVGPRAERAARACALRARADAVAEKTANLIVLEAEDAYRRWEEATASRQTRKKTGQGLDHSICGAGSGPGQSGHHASPRGASPAGSEPVPLRDNPRAGGPGTGNRRRLLRGTGHGCQCFGALT
jgi:outer membrane protein TolC